MSDAKAKTAADLKVRERQRPSSPFTRLVGDGRNPCLFRWCETQSNDVARLASHALAEYSAALKQHKALEAAAASARESFAKEPSSNAQGEEPPSSSSPPVKRLSQQQLPLLPLNAVTSDDAAAPVVEAVPSSQDLAAAGVDLVFCLVGFSWSSDLLLALHQTPCAVEGFLAVCTTQPQGEPFAASCSEEFKSHLYKAASANPEVCADFFILTNCQK